ncbi:MAG: Uma2 family endonuclease [Planctomycetes bacterium]|nr:Uma2 family endonuclease [Planctomycetota bacterium]
MIEVADSSLGHDRSKKLEVYARAGIRQYVIVNLVDTQLEVFEQPVPGEGKYAAANVVGKDGGPLSRVGLGARSEISPAEANGWACPLPPRAPRLCASARFGAPPTAPAATRTRRMKLVPGPQDCFAKASPGAQPRMLRA